ncbi:MAG: hypothetical protein MNPFHGCM_01818 [Gemmatimonadaceae bacterium]|nr:hypothetical protein [Gemmatimonadaceae bacterium]
MSGNDAQVPWTDDQWNTVNRAVQDTARKARVASSFLPLVGPLPSSVTTVPAQRMSNADLGDAQRGEARARLVIEEADVLGLTTISSEVYLKNSEATDPDLSSAIAMLCRAADVIARVEDAVVFNGLPSADSDSYPGAGRVPAHNGTPIVTPMIYRVKGGTPNGGLLDAELKATVPKEGEPGDGIVRAVVDAIQQLEGQGHYGPFACVLGNALFLDANTPSRGSLVLPSDRITPFLNGPLLRSSTVPASAGVVVALAGDPIDLVVATDITAKFLQLSVEPRYVFRVYERIALRIKQPAAACRLTSARK